ncbi:MAG TPA: phosphatase domain-containing protein [Candidatus Sulfomarinibacteraceae bacterium]|nr:phosphatase domain-containing protein [Candidatus Sulfomarinibacteraceae bacterium]
MVDWHRLLAKTAHSIEERVDTLRYRLSGSLGRFNAPIIVPYLGYGSQRRLHLTGRVLQDKGIQKARSEDRIWHNVLNMYRRLESDEVPGARVIAQFGQLRSEVVTDQEGYFDVVFEPAWAEPPDTLWHQVELLLDSPQPAGEEDGQVHTTGHVLIPPRQAQFGVISDIDDTVIRTYATEWLRMARLMLLGNARTRLPFAGVSAFYRALQGGAGAQTQNPLFYVSSSPWNLYDLLVDFFQIQQIPMGPLFLRDWGVTETEILPTDHHGHKLDVICRLLDFYTDLSFILIGDSGQQDPEIYCEVVRRYPHRILSVYIRDVSDDAVRDEAVLALGEEVIEAGSDLILAEDTSFMAEHAVGRGWIMPEVVEDVQASVTQNNEAPTPAEALLEDQD